MPLLREMVGGGSSSGQATALLGGTNTAFAATGSTQTDAAPITTSNVTVTGADGTKGVVLPAMAQGEYVEVFNNSASPLKVYGAMGTAVAFGAANAAFSQPGYSLVCYQAWSASLVSAMVGASGAQPNIASTTLSTVGAGTITAAMIANAFTVRSGAQSATAFTDTTDTAANIIAALPGAFIGQSFWWYYSNNTDAQATIAGGSGVTVSVDYVIPKNSVGLFLVTYTAAGAVSVVGHAVFPKLNFPFSGITTVAASNPTLTAGQILSFQSGVLKCTANGTNAVTTRTGAQMAADIVGIQIGMSWRVRVQSAGDNTVTLTAGASGVTISGTATVATSTYRDYDVQYTAANTFVFTNIGGGTV